MVYKQGNLIQFFLNDRWCFDNEEKGQKYYEIFAPLSEFNSIIFFSFPSQDLVKSHLMYAVREEVEVLKEQIKELIEKNQQLEMENAYLKSNATPDLLKQLQVSDI